MKTFYRTAYVKQFQALLVLVFLLFNMAALGQSVKNNIDIFLKGIMNYYGIPGMQVAVIKQGKIIHLSAYGLANVQFSVPVTAKTLFPINSATKCFIGIAIMQLVEAGKIKLDDVAEKYLNDLPEEWRKITVKQLLTHTSGLPDIVDGNSGKMIAEGEDSIALVQVKKLPIHFLPGERSEYNQTNYVLLGLMIEHISGTPFTSFIEQGQFVPANLTQSRFGDSHDVIPGLSEAYSYTYNRNGLWRRSSELKRVFEEFALITRPAAGINSAAGEIAQWMIALLGGKFINKTSINIMWTPVYHNDGSLAPRALGWSVSGKGQHPAVSGSGGMRSAFSYYPNEGLGVIILTNLRGANPERFIEQVAGFYIPQLHPYTGNALQPAAKAIHQQLLEKGFGKIANVYADLRQKDAEFKLSEYAVNDWGYMLLHTGHIDEAIEVLKLNVQLYSGSVNVYDSLGEAYMVAGNKKKAIENYTRCLQLQPGNEHAKKQLRVLHGR
ncbi:MAG: serine hydrolase [Candidatus Pedobacter colombiensis]|uniref:Serine hydrolase n=1 Tax=Candidatus Pedobacter colombiensis TaxID=3121371 RepID=A0AAJ5W4A6_9SPHI|nr:serine hydrolase [Pedobacter sp.]WEK18263.1 MAG: serine hydrolase [Pedobacter sp.]